MNAKKKPGNSSKYPLMEKIQNLLFIGSILGLVIFLTEHLTNTVGGWIYYLFVWLEVGGFPYDTILAFHKILQVIAFIILSFAAGAVFKRLGLKRANHIAATSIITTYMLVYLFMVAVKTGGLAFMVSQILLFILIGGIITALFIRVFERIRNEDYAALLVFVIIVTTIFGLGWLTDYFRANSNLILGY